MKTKASGWLWMVLGAAWVLGAAGQGIAGLSAPVPFARLSADESRILVLRDGPGWAEEQVTRPRLSSGEVVDFLRVFPASGVYTLPGRELVYPIGWFSLGHEVIASADLSRIVRLNRFGHDWALKFYAEGKEIRSYKCGDLLKGFAEERYRPYSTWDWHHPWHDDFELRGGKVFLTTVERRIGGSIPTGYRETYWFDLETGEITEAEVPRIGLLAVAGCGVIVVASGLLVWRNRRHQRAGRHAA